MRKRLLLGGLGWCFFGVGAVNGSPQFFGKSFGKDRGHARARLEFLMDEQGNAYPIDDPHATELTALYQRSLGQDASTEAVQAMLSYTPVFGDLAGNDHLAAALLGALQSLQTRGVQATLEAVNRGELDA